MAEADALTGAILEEIRTRGPMPFARYMALCLYHPDFGYYTRGLGGGGGRDYLTSSGTHRAFGILLARQAEEMWRLAGRPARFDFVEFGPGEGHFAADFLSESARRSPFAAALRYLLVEPSPALQARQQALLAGRSRMTVRWIPEAELLEETRGEGNPLTGCLFANEVLDAFPVHRVIGTAAGPREVHVGVRDGALVELLEAPSTPRIARFLDEEGIVLAAGQEVDLNLEAPAWMTRVLGMLDRGYMVLIDYGYEARELYHPARRRGTLLAYHRHRTSEDFYRRPGEQDLTAHVDFTALRRTAERAGARCLGLTTQTSFLLSLGVIEMLDDPGVAEPGDLAGRVSAAEGLSRREALKDLFLPGRMGERFKVLVLGKGNVPGNLMGLAAPWLRAGGGAPADATVWPGGLAASSPGGV